MSAELEALKEQNAELLDVCRSCDRAFANWQIGQIPGRPEDILALITQVRAAIAKAEKGQP